MKVKILKCDIRDNFPQMESDINKELDNIESKGGKALIPKLYETSKGFVIAVIPYDE